MTLSCSAAHRASVVTGSRRWNGPAFTSVPTLPGGKLGMTTIVHATDGTKSGAANLTIVALRKGPGKLKRQQRDQHDAHGPGKTFAVHGDRILVRPFTETKPAADEQR